MRPNRAIIPAMPPDTPSRRLNSLCAVAILGQLGVASAALLSVCGQHCESSRLRISMDRAARVVLSIAPTVSVNPVTGTCARDDPPRSGVAPQPIVAASVRVEHLHRLAVAQIGGLYGP